MAKTIENGIIIVCLTIISVAELYFSGEVGGSVFLWLFYVCYKATVGLYSDERKQGVPKMKNPPFPPQKNK